jgi:hypothetical protein
VRPFLFAVVLVPSVALAGGQAVVSGASAIYATAAEARAAATPSLEVSDSVVVTILGEEGDVVRVSTTSKDDCLERMDQAYAITGYVARSQLIPRLAKPLVKTFSDGSAIAIDAGAPVLNGQLTDPMLAAAVPKIAAAQTALGVRWSEASLPATNAEEMVCKNGPQTRAELEKSAAEEWQREDEARREELRRNPPPPPPAPVKKVDKRPAPKTDKQKRERELDDEAAAFADLLVGEGSSDYSEGDMSRSPGGNLGSLQSVAYAPACGISGATINGAPAGSNASDVYASYHVGTRGLGDVRATCGLARVAGTLVDHAGGGSMGIGGGRSSGFKAGPLFWPDGKSAGKLVDTVTIHEVPEKVGTMLCVSLNHVAQKVCHRAADATK